MTLLSYDSTFEGLLTAIFEVFEYKYQEPKIVKNNLVQQNIFSEATEIITSIEKSDRVFKKLSLQLGHEGIRSLLYAFLSEKEGIESVICNVIQYAVANPTKNILKDFANTSVMEIAKVTKSVGREKHRMEAFIRFELLKDGVYFSKIDPDFDVLTLLIKHFKNRYQDQKWLIYDIRRNYGIYYNLENVEIVNLDFDAKDFDRNKNNLYAESEIAYQKLWAEYFDHTNIKERVNKKLHVQHVPKRYWKYLTEKKQF